MSATFKEQLVVVPAEAGTHNHRCQLPESRLTPAPTKAAGLAMSAFALTRGSRLCAPCWSLGRDDMLKSIAG